LSKHQQWSMRSKSPAAKTNGKAVTSGVPGGHGSSATPKPRRWCCKANLDICRQEFARQVFVFAENLCEPSNLGPAARLLISNGARFLPSRLPEPTAYSRKITRSCAIRPCAGLRRGRRTCGIHVVSLHGVVWPSVSRQRLLFTDRGPGVPRRQMVHVRGHRGAGLKGHVHHPDTGEQYGFEVLDARNRIIRQDEVKLYDFGGSIPISISGCACPPGNLSSADLHDDGHNYQGPFGPLLSTRACIS